MKCWACGQETMSEVTGRCSCGATATDFPNRRPRSSKPSNGSLALVVSPELKERLETAARKRDMAVDKYALCVLIRETDRSHHKRKEIK